MMLFSIMAIAAQRVPLPPMPAQGQTDPYATTSEVGLMLVAAVLTLIVGVTLVVFVVRQQRKGTPDV